MTQEKPQARGGKPKSASANSSKAAKKPANQAIELYGLFCPRTGELRYVGKSVNAKQRLAGHISDAHRKALPSSCWIRSLLSDGLAPEMRVLAKVQESEWQEAERALIAGHRAAGTRLLNIADGGEGPAIDTQVAAENGRKNARSRDQRKWRLLLRIAQEAKRFESIGDTIRAANLKMAATVFRGMTAGKQQAFINAHPNWCTN